MDLLVNTTLQEVEGKIDIVEDQLKMGYITKRVYKNRMKVLNSLKSFLLEKEKQIDL
jgi:hypothetical protein